MSAKSLIGIDVGTSGAKAVMLDSDGSICASAFAEYPLSLPQPGWAEQDPEDWIVATLKVISSVVRHGGIPPGEVAGLSFSGQMHGLVCLDADMRVLRPAILWCDTRTTHECRQIEKRLGGPEEVLRHTFNSALEGFTLPKLIWVRNHESEVFRRIVTILLPKDYVRYRLTGEVGMDLSDAAGTLLLDVKEQQWSEAVAAALDVDMAILPPLGKSSEIAGRITPAVAHETGLPVGLPVAFGGADNACAAVGTGVVRDGMMAVSIGTSGTVIAPVSGPFHDDNGRIHTFLHAVPHTWYLMGVMQAAGLSLKWFKDTFAAFTGGCTDDGRDPYVELTAGADAIAPGSEGLIWLPYLNGERTPHLDPNARGVLFGISSRHTRAHIIRAVMEGVAFGLHDSMAIINDLGIDVDSVRITGGGGKSTLWRQIVADIFQKPVTSVTNEEGPAFGAAIIAGVATGIFTDFESAVERTVKVERVTEPNLDLKEPYEKAYQQFRRLYPALRDEFSSHF